MSCFALEKIEVSIFDFFADCRSPLNIANLPVKSPFSRKHFCNFVPIFDRPPSCPCILIKHVTDLNISKSYIGNVPRILLSKKYFIKESSFAFYFLSFSLLYYKEISLVLALFFWLKKKKLHELIYKSSNCKKIESFSVDVSKTLWRAHPLQVILFLISKFFF